VAVTPLASKETPLRLSRRRFLLMAILPMTVDARGWLETTMSQTRYPVRLSVISDTQMRVYTPIQDAPDSGLEAEWTFIKIRSSGMWAMQPLRAVDARGRYPSLQLTASSTHEYAFSIGGTNEPLSEYDFFGMGHGHETRTKFSLTIDGLSLPEGARGTLEGNELVLDLTCTIQKPKGMNSGTDIGTGTCRFTLSAAGCLVEHSHEITHPDLSYYASQAAMLPGYPGRFDRAQSGSNSPVVVGANGNIPAVGQQEATYLLYHTDPATNPYELRMTLPSGGPETSLLWAHAHPPSGWLFDHSNYAKWYVQWIGNARMEITDQIAISTHSQLYEVRYVGP
jgi:hypothetical protein